MICVVWLSHKLVTDAGSGRPEPCHDATTNGKDVPARQQETVVSSVRQLDEEGVLDARAALGPVVGAPAGDVLHARSAANLERWNVITNL